MEELLRKLGISPNLSENQILEALEDKQMEYLDRLDSVEDAGRREKLNGELQEINSAIEALSWTIKRNGGQTATGMYRDTQENFDELKNQQEEPEESIPVQQNSYAKTEQNTYSMDDEYMDAVAAIDNGNVSRGMAMITSLAKRRYAKANMYLADRYREGKYVEASMGQAITHYYRAAVTGNVDAQYIMGAMYYFGEYLEEVDALAFYWLKQAADSKHIVANSILGDLYYFGHGTEKDEKKAFLCYEMAGMGGDAAAQFGLYRCYFHGKGTNGNRVVAQEWLQKSAAQGYESAVRVLNGMR